MIETDNFTRFTDARKFNCHCGLAPFPYQSGSSIKDRTKTHFLRDKTLKSILFKAAGSAIQHDPQLKKYYEQKLERKAQAYSFKCCCKQNCFKNIRRRKKK